MQSGCSMGLQLRLVIVKWVEMNVDEPFMEPFHDKVMRVVYSTHPQYVHGNSFYLGDMRKVCDDGYQVMVIP